MDTNIIKIGLLITAVQFTLAASCNKDKTKPCIGGDIYKFSVSSEFLPQKEAYNLGDTIVLNSTFPKLLLDNISNRSIDYSNSVGIGGSINFGIMDTVLHSLLPAASKFELVLITGTTLPYSYSQENGVNIFFNESINYTFKIGIKLRQKGLFEIAVPDLGSKGIIGQDCTNAGFDMTVTNSNKNINLFQYALGYTPDALLQKSIYCFRVQ